MNNLDLVNRSVGLGNSFLNGALSGYLASLSIVSLIILVLMIIAWWKIFTKAGEAGWKSLIPIYNVYIFCRIIGINFWIYIVLIPVLIGILANFVPAIAAVTALYAPVLSVIIGIKLGQAFKKSILFILGLIFFAPIFELILAFGNSHYSGAKK